LLSAATVSVRVPLAEVATAGVSFCPERAALKIKAAFDRLVEVEDVGPLGLVVDVDEDVVWPIEVELEGASRRVVVVVAVDFVPPSRVKAKTTTTAATIITITASTNRRRRARRCRCPRSLRVTYGGKSGFIIPYKTLCPLSGSV
jgi:hypothetical protein